MSRVDQSDCWWISLKQMDYFIYQMMLVLLFTPNARSVSFSALLFLFTFLSCAIHPHVPPRSSSWAQTELTVVRPTELGSLTPGRSSGQRDQLLLSVDNPSAIDTRRSCHRAMILKHYLHWIYSLGMQYIFFFAGVLLFSTILVTSYFELILSFACVSFSFCSVQ